MSYKNETAYKIMSEMEEVLLNIGAYCENLVDDDLSDLMGIIEGKLQGIETTYGTITAEENKNAYEMVEIAKEAMAYIKAEWHEACVTEEALLIETIAGYMSSVVHVYDEDTDTWVE